MRSVQVLNAGGGEVLMRVSPKKARRMVWRGVAIVHAWQDPDGFGGYGVPRSIELVRYVFAGWKFTDNHAPRVFSKKGVLKRDDYLCAYCPSKATTVDHVWPRALGGKSEWLNCVACCIPCNRKKGHKTLEEAGMQLLNPPFIPK